MVTDDHLALYDFEVVYLPSKWRSESVNHIDMYIRAINYGETIEKGAATNIYTIEQYFSLDGILDESDELQLVKMFGDYDYDFRESVMEKGQIVKSPMLSGRLKIIIVMIISIVVYMYKRLYYMLLTCSPVHNAW